MILQNGSGDENLYPSDTEEEKKEVRQTHACRTPVCIVIVP